MEALGPHYHLFQPIPGRFKAEYLSISLLYLKDTLVRQKDNDAKYISKMNVLKYQR